MGWEGLKVHEGGVSESFARFFRFINFKRLVSVSQLIFHIFFLHFRWWIALKAEFFYRTGWEESLIASNDEILLFQTQILSDYLKIDFYIFFLRINRGLIISTDQLLLHAHGIRNK